MNEQFKELIHGGFSRKTNEPVTFYRIGNWVTDGHILICTDKKDRKIRMGLQEIIDD